MSMSPNEIQSTPGIFLMRRRDWFHRVAMGIPEKPTAGDRRAVRDALLDLIDAAGGLEFSRGELLRVIGIAQEEYSSAMRALGQQSDKLVIDAWGGATVPAVYFAFFEAVTWTRTVIDRFQEPLKEVVQPHDPELWKTLQRIRSESGGQVFNDARTLAGVSLHWYSPPHAGCGAKIVNGKLVYPVVDNVDNEQDFRNNLNFSKGRHAETLVDEYWKAVCIFIDKILHEFYSQ